MTYLSVKALRHYHDVGLLEPVDIDSATGYRRYSTAQVSTAQAIRRFRELDMPIEHVRAVLDAPDVTSRNEAILVHLRHMQQQLERTQTTVASLQALLEDVRRTSTVTRRSIGPTSSLAISETVGVRRQWRVVRRGVRRAPRRAHQRRAHAERPGRRAVLQRLLRARARQGGRVRADHRRRAHRRVAPSGSTYRPPISRCWSTRVPSPTSTARTARSARTSRSSASASMGRSVSTTSWPAPMSTHATTAPRCAGRSPFSQRPEPQSKGATP